MKINPEQAAAVAGSRESAAAQLSGIDGRSEHNVRSVAGHDRVEVSGLVLRIGDGLAVCEAERAVRIEALSKAVESGRYAADSDNISRRLVSERLVVKGS